MTQTYCYIYWHHCTDHVYTLYLMNDSSHSDNLPAHQNTQRYSYQSFLQQPVQHVYTNFKHFHTDKHEED